MDQYTDDLAELIDKLNLMKVVLAGHSSGGEVAHYIGRHGSNRLARLVLVGAVPPLMLKTDGDPAGLPRSVFDGIRERKFDNR
jgi:non-heme chloroperoxidase